jgi:hypothetical protein
MGGGGSRAQRARANVLNGNLQEHDLIPISNLRLISCLGQERSLYQDTGSWRRAVYQDTGRRRRAVYQDSGDNEEVFIRIQKAGVEVCIRIQRASVEERQVS